MRQKQPLRTILIYAFAVSMWILAAAWVVDVVIRAPFVVSEINPLDNETFVLISTALLIFFLGKERSHLGAARRKLDREREQTIHAMASLLGMRDKDTRDHTLRVTRMCLEFARLLGVPASEMDNIRIGSLLHDVGKLTLSDSILFKPGPLDESERLEVHQHPITAWKMMLEVDFLRDAVDIPYAHHENWDGSGYPRGISGEQIPYAVRLFSIVDIWDALIHARVYKRAWDEEEVLDYLRDQAGRQLDPGLVELFIKHYDALRPYGMWTGLDPSASERELPDGKGLPA